MKSRSRTVTVGRNLRRYLGALLAVGFGVSWWSFMPPATAATPAPRARVAQRAPSAAARRVTSVPAFTPPTKVVEVVPVSIDQPTPQPRTKPRPVKRPKVIPPVVEPPPIVEPQTPPIVETPVVETPVVETPVVETPPVVDPVDDPYLSPIITRSS
jgi:hypothetical protein